MNLIKNAFHSADGYKTYVVCLLSLLYAVAGYFTGHVSLQDAFTTAQIALTGAFLRHGIKTDTVV